MEIILIDNLDDHDDLENLDNLNYIAITIVTFMNYFKEKSNDEHDCVCTCVEYNEPLFEIMVPKS